MRRAKTCDEESAPRHSDETGARADERIAVTRLHTKR